MRAADFVSQWLFWVSVVKCVSVYVSVISRHFTADWVPSCQKLIKTVLYVHHPHFPFSFYRISLLFVSNHPSPLSFTPPKALWSPSLLKDESNNASPWARLPLRRHLAACPSAHPSCFKHKQWWVSSFFRISYFFICHFHILVLRAKMQSHPSSVSQCDFAVNVTFKFLHVSPDPADTTRLMLNGCRCPQRVNAARSFEGTLSWNFRSRDTRSVQMQTF